MDVYVRFAGKAVLCGALLSTVSSLQAAGFDMPQYGVREMGVAYGGSAAMLEDASAIAYNPAGLMRLHGRNVTGGATLLLSRFDYDVTAHRERRPLVGGEVPGNGEDRIRGTAVVPQLYYSTRLSENSAVGIGLYVPVGSATEYRNDWVGRYHATTTEITAINLSPAFAWQASSQVSLGVAAVVQYFQGTFENRIDVGYLVADELIDTIEEEAPNFFTGADGERDKRDLVNNLAHNHDVDNRIEADSIAYGLNLGLLWQPSDNTRVGLQYNTPVRHFGEGKAQRPQLDDPAYQAGIEAAICDNAPRLLDCANPDEDRAREGAEKAVGPLGAEGGEIAVDFMVPQKLTLSLFHQKNRWLALTGGVAWTNWGQVKEVRFTQPDGSSRGGSDLTDSGDDVRRRDLVQPFDWEDTFRLGLGAVITPEGAWSYRFGVSFDQSPVPDEARRTPRGPDSDRVIGALGLSYSPWQNLALDLGYTFSYFTDSGVNSVENPAGTDHRLEGRIRGHLHSLAAQASFQF
ncbi:MAG: hypothetical protein EA349_05365 [Halomonadaceae bacterium]|nr:MAG: hypothetical protein EA349_05365 [Halomonadaceae bacterium]